MLLLLLACSTPLTPLRLEEALDGAGLQAAVEGDRLIVARPQYQISLRLQPEADLVVAQTEGLWSLSRSQGEAAAVVLVTQVATLNHELDLGRLWLDAASGQVEMTAEITTSGPEQRVTEAVQRLIAQADGIAVRLASAR